MTGRTNYRGCGAAPGYFFLLLLPLFSTFINRQIFLNHFSTFFLSHFIILTFIKDIINIDNMVVLEPNLSLALDHFVFVSNILPIFTNFLSGFKI